MNYYNSKEQLRKTYRSLIMQELLQHNCIVYEEGITLYEKLRHDDDTWKDLQTKILEDPNPQRDIETLIGVWRVKSFHQQEPTIMIDLLVAEYNTCPMFVRLGKREGLKWISPICPRN